MNKLQIDKHTSDFAGRRVRFWRFEKKRRFLNEIDAIRIDRWLGRLETQWVVERAARDRPIRCETVIFTMWNDFFRDFHCVCELLVTKGACVGVFIDTDFCVYSLFSVVVVLWRYLTNLSAYCLCMKLELVMEVW